MKIPLAMPSAPPRALAAAAMANSKAMNPTLIPASDRSRPAGILRPGTHRVYCTSTACPVVPSRVKSKRTSFQRVLDPAGGKVHFLAASIATLSK